MGQWLNVLVIYFIIGANSEENPNGRWTLSDDSGKYKNLPAAVPGGVYSDLMKNNIIGDILYGNNDTETRWVAKTNWTYSLHVTVDENFLNNSRINILFEGLDTFATVLINDVKVGESKSMFLRYIFDIKDALKLGPNTIQVKFTSPVLMAAALASKQDYPIPPECPSSVNNGECHVNQIRKMQASFSWDWGPAFPSMGIWQHVYVEAFNTSIIRYLFADYEDGEEDTWLIKTTTYLSCKQGDIIQGQLNYFLQTDVNQVNQYINLNEEITGNTDEIRIDYTFNIPKISVKNWWPNGYGTQNLYWLTVVFQSGMEKSSKNIRIGFRKIELVQDETGSGRNFYFKVNNVPIFAKGANLIPLDILPERGQNDETVTRILESAHAANMNMLRVWGGGVYGSDYFYDKADELGILIWQDFMFACAMYPTYPEYLDLVRAEVRHQVKRLRSHPSIALWAGNNENEIALMGNWYGTQKNQTLYKDDYLKLYIDTIRSELFNITSNVIFLASSPTNGKESEDENYLAKNPGNPAFGDVHFYNYLVNSVEPQTYPIPRFASEYGYQSLPDVDTWLTATNNPSDLNPNSDFMTHRQHHPLGFTENDLLIGYQLKLNSSIPDYYKTYIYYSQIVQAMSVKFETEYYRSFMGRLNGNGLGNTMGALFWQLNDVWVAPTWAFKDYTGKWKMLQYFATDFFAPSIITGYLDVSRQLHVFVISEIPGLLQAELDATATIEVYKWDSFDAINSTSVNVTMEFGKSVEVKVIESDDYLEEVGCGSLSTAQTNCFFYLTLFFGDTVIAPRNLILPTSLKRSNLTKTNIKIAEITPLDEIGKRFEITIEAEGISLFVWLDSHKIRGTFTENGFAQVFPVKKVYFEADESTALSELQEVLTVVHLNNPDYQSE